MRKKLAMGILGRTYGKNGGRERGWVNTVILQGSHVPVDLHNSKSGKDETGVSKRGGVEKHLFKNKHCN